MRSKPTLKDVSRLANVSPATVSYVLNGKEQKRISKATTERVLAAVRTLNYMPNNTAKTLKNNRTNCIGVAISKNITTPRYAQTLQGIRTVLEAEGYHIILNSAKVLKGEYPDFLDSYFHQQVDGIIYIAADNASLSREYEDIIVQYHIPAVAVDCRSSNLRICTVDIDYFTGALEMAEHLYAKGVRKIVFIRPKTDMAQDRERELGLRRAAYNHIDLEVDVRNIEFDYTGANLQLYHTATEEWEVKQFHGYARGLTGALERIWGDLDRDTALLCSWGGMEQFALPMAFAHATDVRIGVLAQGLIYPRLYPGLVYSHLPNMRVGIESAKLILSLLQDPDVVRHTILPPTLHDAGNDTENDAENDEENDEGLRRQTF